MAGKKYKKYLKAVRNDPYAFQYVPDELKTPEMCLEAMSYIAYLWKYVPDALRTPEMRLEAVKFYLEEIQDGYYCLEDGTEALKSFDARVDYILEQVPNELRTPEIVEAAKECESEREFLCRDEWKWKRRDYGMLTEDELEEEAKNAKEAEKEWKLEAKRKQYKRVVEGWCDHCATLESYLFEHSED